MSVPFQIKDLKRQNDYFCNKEEDFSNCPRTSFGKENHSFLVVSFRESITSSARESGFSSFFGKEKEVLVNSAKKAYQNIMSNAVALTFRPSYDSSHLVGKDVVLDAHIKQEKREGCLAILKNILLRIWNILKRLFHIEKKEKANLASVNFKGYLKESQLKEPIRRVQKKLPLKKVVKLQNLRKVKLKKSLVLDKNNLLVCRNQELLQQNNLLEVPCWIKDRALFPSKVLKEMWIELEQKDLSAYQWCSLTILTQILNDFSKSLNLKIMSFFPVSQIGQDMFFKWKEIPQDLETMRAILCALFESSSEEDLFSELLEDHGAEDSFVQIAKEAEDVLLPSQMIRLIASIAKNSSRLTSIKARFIAQQRVFCDISLSMVECVSRSLLLLSQLKEQDSQLWSSLMQILVNDALQD